MTEAQMTEDVLLSIRDLKLALPKGADRPFAVDGVSYDLKAGEILCVVGESGSGHTDAHQRPHPARRGQALEDEP